MKNSVKIYPLILLFIHLVTSQQINQDHQHSLFKRQPLLSLESSNLVPISPNPTGSSRLSNSNLTSTDPPSNSSSTSTSNNSSSTKKEKDSPLTPLLGASLNLTSLLSSSPNGSSNNSSSNPTTNPTSNPPTNPTSTSPTPSATPSATPSPTANNTTNKSSTSPSLSINSPSPIPTPSSDSHPPSTNSTIPHTKPAPREKNSTIGSTTIKLIAITGGVVVGLYLLWTIIRKWKFRPSKRFASKLDDYDQHMFEPRPPSFADKGSNGYSSYSSNQYPITQLASPASYPSHLPERTHTPVHSFSRNDMFSQPPSHYSHHRLSNTSAPQSHHNFDSNYRLSLGLHPETSFYPHSDHMPPKVM